MLERKAIDIEDVGSTPTVRQLIAAVVAQEVAAYNNKPLETNLLPFLYGADMEQLADSGKIGFGSRYNPEHTTVAKAQQTALQAFEDGLFVIFANEKELRQPGETLEIRDDTVITFIRLTFLAGSYW